MSGPAGPSGPTPPSDAAASSSTAARPQVKRQGSRTPVYAVVGVIVVVAIVVGVGYSTSWFGLQKSSTGTGGVACATGVTIQGEGASFFAVLMSTWQSSFQTSTANMINYQASGAGAGVTALSQKTVDFAATDEALNASQIASMPGQTLTLPTTGGPLAIIYNVGGVSVPIKLSGAVIAEIYLGTITQWNDPAIAANNTGVSLPSTTIVTVHRLDAAGTSYVLTDFLSKANPTWASSVGTSIQPNWPKIPGAQAQKGNSALAKYVASTANTIGYVDLADAVSAKNAYAGVLNPAGNFVVPTVANTQAAINNLSGQSFPSATGDWSNVAWVNSPGSFDYPLALITYFIVLQNPGAGHTPDLKTAEVLNQWLSWTFSSTAQNQAPGLFYINPPAKLLQQDQSALASMNFNGGSIPTCTS
jgi:phosphate transport system substrate-binding protein